VDHKVHDGHVHECIIKLTDNLPAVDAFSARSQPFKSKMTQKRMMIPSLWGCHFLNGAHCYYKTFL